MYPSPLEISPLLLGQFPPSGGSIMVGNRYWMPLPGQFQPMEGGGRGGHKVTVPPRTTNLYHSITI